MGKHPAKQEPKFQSLQTKAGREGKTNHLQSFKKRYRSFLKGDVTAKQGVAGNGPQTREFVAERAEAGSNDGMTRLHKNLLLLLLNNTTLATFGLVQTSKQS